MTHLTSSSLTSLRSYQTILIEQFFSSVYPTISSGKSSKVMIVSTPHGMNMFYKLWNDSVNGNNSFSNIEVHWSETN